MEDQKIVVPLYGKLVSPYGQSLIVSVRALADGIERCKSIDQKLKKFQDQGKGSYFGGNVYAKVASTAHIAGKCVAQGAKSAVSTLSHIKQRIIYLTGRWPKCCSVWPPRLP